MRFFGNERSHNGCGIARNYRHVLRSSPPIGRAVVKTIKTHSGGKLQRAGGGVSACRHIHVFVLRAGQGNSVLERRYRREHCALVAVVAERWSGDEYRLLFISVYPVAVAVDERWVRDVRGVRVVY